MNPLVFLVADVVVFAPLFVVGALAHWVHPDPRLTTRAHMQMLTLVLGLLVLVATLGASVGVGALGWLAWLVGVAFVGTVDVVAVRKRRQFRAYNRRMVRR